MLHSLLIIFHPLICISLSHSLAGKSTINNEERRNPDAKPQTVVEVEEEERRRWMSADGSSRRSHEAAGCQAIPRRILSLDG